MASFFSFLLTREREKKKRANFVVDRSVSGKLVLLLKERKKKMVKKGKTGCKGEFINKKKKKKKKGKEEQEVELTIEEGRAFLMKSRKEMQRGKGPSWEKILSAFKVWGRRKIIYIYI